MYARLQLIICRKEQMSMIKLRTFDRNERLVAETEELLRERLASAGNLMLSGGSTPYTVYNRIAAVPCTVHPDRRLFLSDERMVPPDSPQSNAGNLLPMLRALDCEDRFIRVDTGLGIEESAHRFARDLEPLEHIHIGLLGMGTDGHTAGIFTHEQARMTRGDLTLHCKRPDGLHGVSVTPALFSRIERIVLLVTGESKRTVIDTLMQEPASIPAGIALSGHSSVELWTDIAL